MLFLNSVKGNLVFFDYSVLSLVWKITISTGKIRKNMLISFSVLLIEMELNCTIMIFQHGWVNVWKQMVNSFLLNFDYLTSSWSEGWKWLHLACPYSLLLQALQANFHIWVPSDLEFQFPDEQICLFHKIDMVTPSTGYKSKGGHLCTCRELNLYLSICLVYAENTSHYPFVTKSWDIWVSLTVC